MKEKTPRKEERKPKAGQDGGKAEAVEKSRAEPTKKLACACRNAFQDDTYGKGVRVFNRAGKGPGSRQYRCTVCQREVTV